MIKLCCPGEIGSGIADWVMTFLLSSAQGCVVLKTTTIVALSTIGWALVPWARVPTFGTSMVGSKGVLVDG